MTYKEVRPRPSAGSARRTRHGPVDRCPGAACTRAPHHATLLTQSHRQRTYTLGSYTYSSCHSCDAICISSGKIR